MAQLGRPVRASFADVNTATARVRAARRVRRRRSGGTGVLRCAHAPCRTRTRGCGNGQTADPSHSSRSSCGRRDRSPRRTTAEPEPKSRRSRLTQTTSRHCDTTAYTSVAPLPSTLVLRTSSWFRQITARPGSGGRGDGFQPTAYTLDTSKLSKSCASDPRWPPDTFSAVVTRVFYGVVQATPSCERQRAQTRGSTHAASRLRSASR